jgi:hypothetical protein
MRTYKKLNKNTKHLKTMKGGASGYASARPSSRPYRPSARPSDGQPGVQQTEIAYHSYVKGITVPSVVENGKPIHKFFSPSPYDCITSYSDHAPIVYEINPFVNIITWNVGNFGNEEYSGANMTYNHKFNLDRREEVDEYILRLMNIVSAMRELINVNKSANGKLPFLFCQELPQMEHGGPNADRTHQKMLIDIFTKLLQKNDLEILGNPIFECSLIYDRQKGTTLQYIPNLSHKSYQNRYSFFSTQNQETYYVNMHVAYKSNLEEEIKRCIDEIYHISPAVQRIFFLGDMNRSLLHQKFDGLQAKNFVIYTTPNNSSFALADNKGTKNEHNVDGVLQVLF